MASLQHAALLSRQLDDIVQQNAGSDDSEAARSEALRIARLVVSSLEKPEDLAFETGLLPSYTLCCRIAVKLDLFSILAKSDRSTTISELASVTRAEPLLLSTRPLSNSYAGTDTLTQVRIMRMLSALGLVQEVAKEKYKALPVTRVMAAPPMMAAQRHFWDQGVTCMAKFPEWLDKNGLKCPSDPTSGLFQYAFGTGLEAFDYWHRNPDIMNNVNTLMEGVRSSRPNWVEWFPVQDRILNGVDPDKDAVTLVDIGGGRGHDLEVFRKSFPQGKGKLVLEDLPAVIDDVKTVSEDIVLQKYDFFQTQPVKDARAYYFSHIFHDWSDAPSVEILKNTSSAMTKGYSKVFINDIILPDTNCSLLQAGFDINMMAMHAGIERSREQWTTLLAKAGFEVLQFWLPPGDGEGIVEATLKP